MIAGRRLLLTATLVLALGLLALRLVDDGPGRLARAADEPPAAEPRAVRADEAAAAPPAWPSAFGARFDLATPDALARALASRAETLERREAELVLREEALAAADGRLAQRIAELEARHAELAALVDELEAEEEERARSLARLYEQMRPKDAARIFDRLELAVLLRVVTRMRELKSAAIMAQMDPRIAERLTVELARQRDLERPRVRGD